MSSLFTHWSEFTPRNILHLLGIFIIALLVNRLLRAVTNLLIKHASTPARAAQLREQQTRTMAGVLYAAASKVIWGIALLTALPEFGINVAPVAAVARLASVEVGFGAQNLIRDIITGFYIVLEDQFGVGDTIQVGDTVGRVEHLTLRRTVVRDARGAIVTIANGEIRTVSNRSEEHTSELQSLAYAPEIPLD